MPDPFGELSLSQLADAQAGVIERQRFVMSGDRASIRYLVDMRTFLAAVKLASGWMDAQKLLNDRELEIDGVTFDPGPVNSFQVELKSGSILKLGKDKYLKLVD